MDQKTSLPWWLPPVAHIHPAWWVVLAAILVVVDYRLGPFVQPAVLYAIPVCLAAWYSRLSVGVLMALILPAIRFTFMAFVWNVPWDVTDLLTTFTFRIAVFILLAATFHRLACHERAMLQEVKTLRTLLSICMYCKGVHLGNDKWQALEHYISSRSSTDFSHGLCPTCAEQHWADEVLSPEEPVSSLQH